MRVPYAFGLFSNFWVLAWLGAFTAWLFTHDIANALSVFAGLALGGGLAMLSAWMNQRGGPPADLMAEFLKPISRKQAASIVERFGIVAKSPTDQGESEAGEDNNHARRN